jgi:AAA family ATP:ADP antiporter
MAESQDRETDKGPLERALGVFADVRAGEAATALLLAVAVFFLLAAYYVVKPVRDALITALPNGPKIKSYMGAAVAVALLFVVPAYGRFAARVRRDKLLGWVGGLFVSNLVLFFVLYLSPLMRQGVGEWIFALVLFVWAGVFSMMIVAQFWAFANDVYTEAQGKRLFALVAIGQAVGGVVGTTVVAGLVERLGTAAMFVVSAGLLAVGTAVTLVVSRREEGATHRKQDAPLRAPEPAKPAGPGPFALVFKHRYLTLIAAFCLVFTLVNTNGEYVKDELIKGLARTIGEERGLDKQQTKDVGSALFADFYLWVNIGTVVIQSFIVSRLVKYLGLARAFFIMPFIALVDASLIAAVGVWSVVRIGKIAENSTDYSLNNTLRNMLWLPTTKEMKYIAKQATDTFFVRMGDVSSMLCVLLFAETLDLGVRAFGLINLVLVGVWLWLARAIVTENRRLTEQKALANGGAEPKA